MHESSRRVCPDPQRVSTEGTETAQPAGENDDLLMLASPANRVEHSLNAIVVTIDQRVVENDGNGVAPLGEHSAHRKTNKNGDLLLRAVGKSVECFRTLALDSSDGKAISQLKFRAGK